MIATLAGSNRFMLSQRLAELVGTFVNEHGELALERFDGADLSFEQLKAAVENLPFLAVRKMVVVRSASENKELSDKLGDLFDYISDTTDLVFVEPKIDKRGTLYKTLKQKSELTEFKEEQSVDLMQWVVGFAKKEGGEISPADARLLIDRVGANQQMLASEVTKLVLYNPKITQDSIVELVDQSPRSSVFDLLDAAFRGDDRTAMRLYDEQRLQRVEPQVIIGVLVWQLHLLALAKAGEGVSPDQISKDSGVSAFALRKSVGLTRKLTLTQIAGLIEKVRRLDERLKSEAIDADESLRLLLLKISKSS